MKKILVLLVDRANYGRLKPVMVELKKNPEIKMDVMVSGTMTLERFGLAEKIVEADGFDISSRIYMEVEGGNPTTMAKSLGLSIVEYSTELNRLKPDFLLLIGDRYEALGAAIAAAYMNICVIHLQGGEVSGSIDESARHAISKFAHYHFPSTERSKDYLIRMGEDPLRVFNFGCPVADLVADCKGSLPENVFHSGVGAEIQNNKDYLLVIHHPVTTDFGESKPNEINIILEVLEEMKTPTVWLWPNIDAGTDKISKELRRYRENHENNWVRFFKNFPPDIFLQILKNAKCAIGNSSSFVRDSSLMGTPVVMVGDRQFGRETSSHLLKVSADKNEIRDAIRKQIDCGKYRPSNLYGAKGSSILIADKISKLEPFHKKFLHYVSE